MPKLSLPVRLALLVAGTTLPLILFAGGMVLNDYHQARSEATGRVLDNVRSMRLVLDAEVQLMTGGLRALTLSRALRDGNLDDFRTAAAGFLEQFGEGGVLLVSDRQGNALFSSLTQDQELPTRNNSEIVEKVFASKAPVYSDLLMGSVSKRLGLTIEVPFMRDGEVVYDISFSPPMEIFQRLVEQQRPDERWVVTLLDGKGMVFARAPNKDMFGKRATPTLYDEMFRKPEGVLSPISLEGIPLTSAYTRSTLTGWTVAAGIPESSLAEPLWRNLAITSLIGGVLLLTGLGFALRMAATIARSEMLHGLLVEELNHRVKNTMALLRVMAVQTFQSAHREEREKFEGRLMSLAKAHNLLSRHKWEGSKLREVLTLALQPYMLSNPDRVRISGPDVPLSPRLAVVMSMIVHEMATNAAKYGAFSTESGTLKLDWEVMTNSPKPKLRLIWTETGGPLVAAPLHRGFGSRLIERSARDQLGGEATVDFLPGGIVFTLTCILDRAR